MTRNTELAPLLKRLKLSTMLDTLPERIALARREQLDYSSFLAARLRIGWLALRTGLVRRRQLLLPGAATDGPIVSYASLY